MTDAEALLRIGEVASRAGTSTRALRYYEEQGLLMPTRLPNGYRGYAAVATVHATNIQLLLRAGLTVPDVRDALDHGCLDHPLQTLPPCSGSLDAAAHRLAALDERIATLVEARTRLADQLRRTQVEIDGCPGRVN